MALLQHLWARVLENSAMEVCGGGAVDVYCVTEYLVCE
jgi:hypothetical protein